MVVKMRGGNHSKDIREYVITDKGVVVIHPRRTDYDGLTTGIPSKPARARRKRKKPRRNRRRRIIGNFYKGRLRNGPLNGRMSWADASYGRSFSLLRSGWGWRANAPESDDVSA